MIGAKTFKNWRPLSNGDGNKLIAEPEIERFISVLVARLETKKVFASVENEMKLKKENWDKVAKRKVGEVVKQVFKRSFPEEDVSKAVYVEGDIGFEYFLSGSPEVRKWPYKLFGGIGVYPDIAIMRPVQVLIELDNSGDSHQGLGGSRFKSALAKAAFGYMTDEWKYCFVFFHNRCRKSMKPYLERQREKKILEKYASDFHTQPFLFEYEVT